MLRAYYSLKPHNSLRGAKALLFVFYSGTEKLIYLKSYESLWVTNQRIHFTFLPPDVYTGLCYLTDEWTVRWIEN